MSDILNAAVWESSKNFQLDNRLILAIMDVESGCEPLRCHFEPGWNDFYHVDVWAKKCGITVATEKNQQMTSWGAMQVMGAVARELGFMGHLPQLTDTKIGIYYGCLKLFSLSKKYHSMKDVIAAYNRGTPVLDTNGRYINQSYVDKVMRSFWNMGGT